MEIIEIPFNEYIGILKSDDDPNAFKLVFNDNLKNHLGTFHASAQYALAEACSGLVLQTQFPDLKNSVIPVLRKSETKFKRPATSDIKATAKLNTDNKEKFVSQFERKGRAAISVSVEITDDNSKTTMVGKFEWFVQKM